ncbi:phenylalanine--tRNA ligase subunit alpha [Rickettsiales bacterium]|nr:phenylalanine--tRNA ligase subunit alpha [Rickettsiales bacterium]
MLEQINKEGCAEIKQAENLENLEKLRVEYLGKKGKVTSLMKQLGQMEADKRKEFGAQVNKVKQELTNLIDEKKAKLETIALNKQLESQWLDVTLPVRPENEGRIHPISYVIDEIIDIFAKMGFQSKEGPEIEDDFHNFTALNIPENHPARQMQDTFYFPANDDDKIPSVLRTHTSSVQIRTMEGGKPPFKFIAPGRVYRSDYDMTHTPMFHQVEGLYIDKDINFGHLKGCLYQFLKTFFELDEVPLRFRPSFFPFTEPSAEVDIGCAKGKDELKIGAGDDWLEILGCGMVHPNVLKNVGIDPQEYQGFAFGVGVERMAMLKYGAPDLRAFFDSDIRWLNHYGF